MNFRKAMLVGIAFCSCVAGAQVRLPLLLSDHAVLQREQPIHVWGWATTGDTVTVSFHEQRMTAKVDALGKWSVALHPEKAGGPYVLRVAGGEAKDVVERKDVLVGDVWIAGGQSNMEFPLKGFVNDPTVNADKEIAAANHPQIRLLLQRRRLSDYPMDDAEDVWTECTPETTKDFSAVGYFFARAIQEDQKVPVGVIDVTWGGTPAAGWMSAQGIADASLPTVAMDAAATAQGEALDRQKRAEFELEDARAKEEGKAPKNHPVPASRELGAWQPSVLYNGMLAPDTAYTIKGAIWYQGENDTFPIKQAGYRRVFPALIQDWRRMWGEGDFPFLFVQLSSFDMKAPNNWGLVRDAQRRTLSLRNTAMAVTLDIGTKNNIHPPNKQDVGGRLAVAAREMVYGERVEGTSPEFVQATEETQGLRVWLRHADGLHAKDGDIGGFEVAGEDGVFQPATVKIEVVHGWTTILVSSPTVERSVFVRYNWANYVDHFLYNNAGLPMGTFSSEP